MQCKGRSRALIGATDRKEQSSHWCNRKEGAELSLVQKTGMSRALIGAKDKKDPSSHRCNIKEGAELSLLPQIEKGRG